MKNDGGLHGWLVIDKPLGLTSRRVVDIVRRHADGRVGHAGTLDPLATGVLPVAIGEATKTTAYAMAGRKRYRFRIRWGIARTTDDLEGEVTGECAARPSREAIEAALPRFLGRIRQHPPAYSAIKINGSRAYKLARTNAQPILPMRTVDVAELRLISIPDGDHADCEALVGKGTYIRALARDLGATLGTVAHVAQLRRLSVGRFAESQAVTLDLLAEQGHISSDCRYLLPIETALDDIPALVVTAAEAARLRSGRRVMPGPAHLGAVPGPVREGAVVGAWYGQSVVALARIENGLLRPVRVINR
jgi:tRNA pseudouridine55 synthase